MNDISMANKHYFFRHYKIFQPRQLVIRLLSIKKDFSFEKHQIKQQIQQIRQKFSLLCRIFH